MKKLHVKIINKSGFDLPKYETIFSAGMDLRALVDEAVTLKPFERNLINTRIFIQLPIGYEAQIRHRSGISLKKGITVLNTPGTIN